MRTDRIVFLDTETTGLDPRTRLIWDLGLIVREHGMPDVEHQWFIEVPLTEADPMALQIGRYFDRHPNPYRDEANLGAVEPADAARKVSRILNNALIVGAVPWFDMTTIEALLRSEGLAPNWHYHLIDVETLAAGHKGLKPPWNFDKLLADYGLIYTEAERHSAIGDARMARDLYDRIITADARRL